MGTEDTKHAARDIAAIIAIVLGILYLVCNPNQYPKWALVMGWAMIMIGVALLVFGHKVWQWPLFHPSRWCVSQKKTDPSDPRCQWLNKTYDTTFRRVHNKEWDEIDNKTGARKWGLTETDRTRDFVELRHNGRGHRFRVYAIQMDLLKDSEKDWTFCADGCWENQHDSTAPENTSYGYRSDELGGRLKQPVTQLAAKVAPILPKPQELDVSAIVSAAERTAGWEEKFRLYEQAASLEPTNSAFHRQVAYCALNLQRFDLAEKYDREAVRLDPSNIWAWVGLVVSGSLQGNRNLTEEAFRRVEELSHGTGIHFVEASFYLGLHLYRSGEKSRAEPFLQTVANSKIEGAYFVGLRRGAERYLGLR